MDVAAQPAVQAQQRLNAIAIVTPADVVLPVPPARLPPGLVGAPHNEPSVPALGKIDGAGAVALVSMARVGAGRSWWGWWPAVVTVLTRRVAESRLIGALVLRQGFRRVDEAAHRAQGR